MIRGGCLCGGVRFEIERAAGPFELCHCTRCRKASGSAFVPGIGVRAEDFRLLAGAELIRSWEAPVREHPPGYRVAFCSRCGSPAPSPPSGAEWFEIPAGLLDDDPQLRPDRHIFVENAAPWFAFTDALPRLTKAELVRLRAWHGDAPVRTPVHTPRRTRRLAPLLAATLLGFLVWAAAPLLFDVLEPWDTEHPFYLLAMLLGGALVGWRYRGALLAALLGAWLGQLVAWLVLPGHERSWLLLALVTTGVGSLLVPAGAAIGALLRRWAGRRVSG